MPAAVQAYVDSGNLQEIRRIQEDITEFYRNDITRYCNERDVLLVKRIFDLMPAQLNQQNKRFIATSVGKVRMYVWGRMRIVSSGLPRLALPYLSAMSLSPASLSCSPRRRRCSSCSCPMWAPRLRERHGSRARHPRWEERQLRGPLRELCGPRAACAWKARMVLPQQKAWRAGLSHRLASGKVLPIEVRSGKDYHRYRALRNVPEVDGWGLDEAVVLDDGNVEADGKTTYLPTYAAGWLDAFAGLEW